MHTRIFAQVHVVALELQPEKKQFQYHFIHFQVQYSTGIFSRAREKCKQLIVEMNLQLRRRGFFLQFSSSFIFNTHVFPFAAKRNAFLKFCFKFIPSN